MVTLSEFIANVQLSRETLQREVLEPALANSVQLSTSTGWTLKELLVHITWYEREMVDMLQARVFKGSSLWEIPLDKRNARILAESQAISQELALSQFHQVHLDLMRQLALLSDADLNDPARFPGMPLDWQPWQVIASNTYEHYTDHLPAR